MKFNEQERSGAVTLSAAKGLSPGTEMLRCAQHDITDLEWENS